MGYITPTTDHFQLPFPRETFGDRWGVMTEYRRAHGMAPHRGTDFIVPGGTPVPAVAHSRVYAIFPEAKSPVLGNVLVMSTKLRRTLNGKRRILYVGYSHLDRFNPQLKQGQNVKRGFNLGLVGSTGSAAQGDHLHMTFSYEPLGVFYGTTFDPIPLITNHDGS